MTAVAADAATSLRGVLDETDATAGKERALATAALVLEAAAWCRQPAEKVRSDLLREVETTLATHEEAALRGEPGYRVSATSIDRAARPADGPSEGREREVQADMVELAALCIRASINLERYGRAAGPHQGPPMSWQRHVTRVAWDVAMAPEDHTPDDDPATRWLWAIGERAPSDILRLADDPHGDPCLRAEARLACRRAWTQRAVTQFALWSTVTPFSSSGASTLQRLSQGAIALLRASDLARRPTAFRQQQAWEADHARLLAALQARLDHPQPGWGCADARPRTLVMANVVRAIVATALIDGQLGDRDL